MSLLMIILFPLVGFLINGFLYLQSKKSGKKVSSQQSGLIATIAMFLSFLVSVSYYFNFKGLSQEARLVEQNLFSWIKLGSFHVDFALRLDSLSLIFTLIITGVGSLIHLYSIGYMKEDSTPAKYFSFLNLFCFMMLNLVLGSSMPHVFLGWEGVGLASYLLIGYWNQDTQKVLAGQKAFVMNRIGDLGFLIAMFVAYKYVGSLDLIDIQKATMSSFVVTVFCGLVFFACTGKSAQIPLFTWLPDAMAGPTPVSALIHAATMVTSGIYLLNRISPLLLQTPQVLSVIAMVGVTTAFVAAIIACAQKDIKKILAYSTVSQLGFMFLACGVGAFDAGVFHVMTHAFFKALMFLCAGSVIHALHEEQNIFKMGGLAKKIPITTITFVMGWAAILGLPPFSGFFSKDEIIIQSLNSEHGNQILFIMALLSALLTAFYMTRLLVLVFFSPSRMDSDKEAHVHESPMVMTIPLIVLAILSLIGGFWHHSEESQENAQLIMIISVAVALLSAGFSFYRYRKFNKEEKTNQFIEQGLGIDVFYNKFFGNGMSVVAKGFSKWIEDGFIQKGIKFCSWAVEFSGSVLKSFQVGSVQVYLMMMIVLGFALMVWVLQGVMHGVLIYGK
jgi:NADH-quinone oxidoreductase subunit L